MDRPFPTPWRIVETADAFRIEDASGCLLACTFFHAEADGGDGRLSKEDAYRIAIQIEAIPRFKAAIVSVEGAHEVTRQRHAREMKKSKEG